MHPYNVDPKILKVDHQWIKTMQPQNSSHENVDYSGSPHKKMWTP